jgi:hypothetical protein
VRSAVLALLGLGLAVAACAPSGTAPPTHTPPTASPTPTAVGSQLPLSTPPPSATASVSPTPGVQSCADVGEASPCISGDTSVEFVSPDTGWVVGPDVVLATTTGGRQWEEQYAPHQMLLGSDFLDAEHGWVVGTSTLFRTDDGGASWQSLGEPSLPLWSVHFVSPLHGWGVIGDNDVAWNPEEDGIAAPPAGGRLVATTDGGQTWRQLDGPPNVESVCFSDAGDGWLGVPGAVYRSLDGGGTWKLAFSEPEVDGVPGGEDTFVECANSPSVWVYFHGEGGALSHEGYAGVSSVDGVHWQVVLDEPYTESMRWGMSVPQGPGSYPGPFSVISPSTAVFLGFTPPEGCGGVAMMVASKGGSALSPELTVPLNLVNSAAFISPAVGWVVGAALGPPGTGGCGNYIPEVVMTADGGRTWSEQYTGQL